MPGESKLVAPYRGSRLVPAKEARGFHCRTAWAVSLARSRISISTRARPSLRPSCLLCVKQNPAEWPTAGLGPVPKPQGTRYQVQLINSLNVSRFPCLRRLSQRPGWGRFALCSRYRTRLSSGARRLGCGAICATDLIAPASFESRATADRKRREMRNASTRLALMCVEKSWKLGMGAAHVLAVAAALISSAVLSVPVQRGGSVRPDASDRCAAKNAPVPPM